MEIYADVHSHRQSGLNTLVYQVEEAYSQPRLVHLNTILMQAEEDIEMRRLFGLELATLPNDAILTMSHQQLPSEVRVCNPHDYVDLLEVAYRRLALGQSMILNRLQCLLLSEDTLQHELHHIVPLLDQPDLEVWCAVDFIADPLLDIMGITPSIHLLGHISKAVYLDAMGAVLQLSPGDQAILDRE